MSETTSKPTNKTEPLCFRLDRKNIEKLDELADEQGLTRATYLRFEVLNLIGRKLPSTV